MSELSGYDLISLLVAGVLLFVITSWFRSSGSAFGRFVLAYSACALLFAVIHFVTYRNHPDAYIFVPELRLRASLQAVELTRSEVDSSIKRLSALDVVLFRLREDQEFSARPFELASGIPANIADGVFRGTLRVDMRLVGPRSNPEPVYRAFMDVGIVEPYRGLQAGEQFTFRLGEIARESVVLHGRDLQSRLLAGRGALADHLRTLYVKDSAAIVPFGMTDFFYFTFTVAGAGDVFAATRWVCLLVVLQILLTTALPFAFDRGSKGSS